MTVEYRLGRATLSLNGVEVPCENIKIQIPDRIDTLVEQRYSPRAGVATAVVECEVTHLNPKAAADIVGPFFHGSDEKYQEGLAENERLKRVMQSLKTLFLD